MEGARQPLGSCGRIHSPKAEEVPVTLLGDMRSEFYSGGLQCSLDSDLPGSGGVGGGDIPSGQAKEPILLPARSERIIEA